MSGASDGEKWECFLLGVDGVAEEHARSLIDVATLTMAPVQSLTVPMAEYAESMRDFLDRHGVGPEGVESCMARYTGHLQSECERLALATRQPGGHA